MTKPTHLRDDQDTRYNSRQRLLAQAAIVAVIVALWLIDKWLV